MFLAVLIYFILFYVGCADGINSYNAKINASSVYSVFRLRKMATATETGDEEYAENAMEKEISELRSAKKELFEKARPINEELERIAKRERECVDQLHRIRVAKHDRKQQQDTVKRLIELESELNHAKCENAKLKQSLDKATKHSKAQLQKIAELESSETFASSKPKYVAESKDNSALVELEKQLRQTMKLLSQTKEKLNEMRQRLSDVQERLTVAEQVTAATQQRGLLESGNSDQLLLELTPQHQPTTHTGMFLT